MVLPIFQAAHGEEKEPGQGIEPKSCRRVGRGRALRRQEAMAPSAIPAAASSRCAWNSKACSIHSPSVPCRLQARRISRWHSPCWLCSWAPAGMPTRRKRGELGSGHSLLPCLELWCQDHPLGLRAHCDCAGHMEPHRCACSHGALVF